MEAGSGDGLRDRRSRGKAACLACLRVQRRRDKEATSLNGTLDGGERLGLDRWNGGCPENGERDPTARDGGQNWMRKVGGITEEIAVVVRSSLG